MPEYIEREAFVESQQHLYCENCARRKDGKGRAKNKRLMVQRGEDCPLIPVPPHGRLIDADEFFKALSMDDRVSIPEAIHVQSILSEVPTIIPAEEGET